MSKDPLKGPAGGTGPQRAFVGALSSVVVAFTVLWTVAPYGMFPHDEGQYGQSAVRILAGELPHRDFHEMYSGGLSYWHALLFWLFGEQLIVLRRALVILAMPAVLAAYAIALRFTASSTLAAIVAVASVTGMIGTNHAAAPTTYMTVLSVSVVWLLIKDAEAGDDDLWRIMLVGVLCGITIAIKITGLFTLAAAGLAITFHGTEQRSSATSRTGDSGSAGWLEHLYRWAVASAAIGAAPLLVAAHPTVNSLGYFAMPTVAMGVALLGAGHRFDPWKLALRHAFLCGGVLAAVLIFLTPWIAAGALGDLLEGLFVRPRIRLDSSAYYPPPSWVFLPFALPPMAACLGTRLMIPLRQMAWTGVGSTIVLLATGLLTRQPVGAIAPTILAAMDGWRWLPAVGCPTMAWLLVRGEKQERLANEGGFAVAAMTAFIALNQYPFAHSIYFLFVWPFISLLIIAIGRHAAGVQSKVESEGERRASSLLPAVIIVSGFVIFCFLRFGLWGVVVETRFSPQASAGKQLSGLIVPRSIADEYLQLTALLNQVLRPDQTVLAGPDSPDVYFFTGRRNPTPVMYDMFISRDEHALMLHGLVRANDIGAVIVNTLPAFSEPWSEEVGQPLVQHMRRQTQIGKFAVFFDRGD